MSGGTLWRFDIGGTATLFGSGLSTDPSSYLLFDGNRDLLISDFAGDRILKIITDVDLDNDNDVDGNDFLKIQRLDPGKISPWTSQFGRSYQPPVVAKTEVAVPEPTLALITGLLGTVLLPRIRNAALRPKRTKLL